jgi:hypothetical protein
LISAGTASRHVPYNVIGEVKKLKQRFLNQKLGKRNSRRAEINKAKRLLNRPRPRDDQSQSTRRQVHRLIAAIAEIGN